MAKNWQNTHSIMIKLLLIALIFAIYLPIFAYSPTFVSDPIVSPDGQNITFIYLNDLWEVSFTGGVARRLTALQAGVYRPSYSPDGQWITFACDRDGRSKLYRMPASGGLSEIVTGEEFAYMDWYPDSKSMLVTKSSPGRRNSYMRYDLSQKRPVEIVAYAGTFASLSPDAKKIAFDTRGYPYRPAYQGSAKGTIWLYDIPTDTFSLLIDTEYTVRYPFFSKTHPNRLYFAKSDSSRFQLCYIDNYDISTLTQITHLTDWSARKPSIARKNDRIAFEYFDQIYTYDPATTRVQMLNIDIREDNLPYPTVNLKILSELTNGVISPNEKWLAFEHKYDLFIVPAKGGEVKQITTDHRGIQDLLIHSDNETIYFISAENGLQKMFTVNINKPKEIKMVEWSRDKYIRSFGTTENGETAIRYDTGIKRNLRALLQPNGNIIELLSDEPGNISLYVKTKDSSRFIYNLEDPLTAKLTLKLKDTKANTTTDLFSSTNHIGSMIFDAGEKYLFYNDWSNIYKVNLTNEIDTKEKEWDKILKTTTTATSKPTSSSWDISSENFTLRRSVVVKTSGYPLFTTPDSTLYYLDNGIKSIKFDGSSAEDIITITEGYPHIIHISDNKSTLYYIHQNRLRKLDLKTKKAELIDFTYEYTYDKTRLNEVVFQQAWGVFGQTFYDPTMHNTDWNAQYSTFAPFAKKTHSPDNLTLIMEEMIGRVNASHTGFYPRSDEQNKYLQRANVGIWFDYATTLAKGVKIRDIYFGSELYQKYGIREGDTILQINDTDIDQYTAIDPLFVNQIDKDISLKIQTRSGIVDATVKGLSASANYDMRYDDIVRQNYQTVQKASNGKIGYLRIRNMANESLPKFEQDFLALNRDTEAMIIDVRGNTGGRISGRIFDIITRSPRSYHSSRDNNGTMILNPINVYQKPIVCLIDEDSFSDAEVFGALFRDLNLGTIIGMPTSGSVIGTTEFTLMDGSSMRMPRTGWYRLNKENMELNGAKPDIYVPRLPHHIVKNQDPQLEAAIAELMKVVK